MNPELIKYKIRNAVLDALDGQARVIAGNPKLGWKGHELPALFRALEPMIQRIYENSEPTDELIAGTMKTYGGAFAAALADAFAVANSENRNRIKTTWADLWDKYTSMARSLDRPLT